MAKLITFTEVEDNDGRIGDVTYRVPSGIDVDGWDEDEIAEVATNTVWNYEDGPA